VWQYVKRQFNQDRELTKFANMVDEKAGQKINPQESVSDLMEKSLIESEQMYRRIFEDSIDGMLLWNNQYQIVDLNYMAERMFGRSKERLIGRSLFELFPLEKRHEIHNHIGQVLQSGEHSSAIIFDLNDHQKRYFEYSTKREIVEGLNVTVFQDITEKVEIEEQLRKSETLNVIGELAAGIAHEIRNPMTALKGFIQLLEGSIMEEHSMYYQVITSELERIESIINEFLLLAKPQSIRFQEKDINQIMKETLDLLNAQAVLHNVQFETIYDPQLPLIFCEPNQLKKVFVNLIKNAIEVMPDGGIITVTIKRSEKNQIHISIQDEGIGISKEKLMRLGEPFYTTKERGTGLGLMVSYRIIEEHRGQIRIESEEGNGTIFHIFLPIDHQNNSKKTTSY
jgi:two-component system, sporulation sensor kinase E